MLCGMDEGRIAVNGGMEMKTIWISINISSSVHPSWLSVITQPWQAME